MIDNEGFSLLSEREKREVLRKLHKQIQNQQLQKEQAAAISAEAEVSLSNYRPFPLSDMQESFSIGKFFGGVSDRVGCHIYFELEEYNLDIARLVASWNQLMMYHEMLRVVILPNQSQRVLEDVPEYTIRVYDMSDEASEALNSHLKMIRSRMSHRLYEVGQWPLFEICVSRLQYEKYIIHFSIDEWIVDGYSIALLFKQWYMLYHNLVFQLPRLEFTFREYIAMSRKYEESRRFSDDLEYWMKKYTNVPNGPSLPYASDPEHPSGQSYFERKRYKQSIDRDTWGRLKEICLQMEVSQTALLILCFNELLSYWSSDENFSIILTFFNRPPVHRQVDQIVGPFVSTHICSNESSRQLSLKDKLTNYQRQLWNDLDHSTVSGIRALRELRVRNKQSPHLSVPVVFTSMLNNGGKAAEGSWLSQASYSISQTPQVYLDHQVYERDQQLIVQWDVVEEYFTENTICSMFSEYIQVIKLLTNPDNWHEVSLKRKLEKVVPLVFSPENKYSRFRLSDMQQAQLFERIHKKVSCRIYQEFDLEDLDITRLQNAWNRVIQTHDMLRTVISENGTQEVLLSVPEYKIIILSDGLGEHGVESMRREKLSMCFRVDEWPLFDLSVSLRAGKTARIHLTVDALIADGASMAKIYHELFEIYTNPTALLKVPDLTYREYLQSMKRFKRTKEGKEISLYWQGKFISLPTGPSLPYLKRDDLKYGYKHLEVQIHNWRKIKKKAEELLVKPEMILFTAFTQVLKDLNGPRPFTVVYVDWNRMHLHPDIDRVIGDFTSLSWVIIEPSDTSLVEKARIYQQTVQNDLDHGVVGGLGELRKKMMTASEEDSFSLPVVFTNPIRATESPLPPQVKMGFGQSITPGVYLDNMSYEHDEFLVSHWDYDESVLPSECVEEMFKRYYDLLTDWTNDVDKGGQGWSSRNCIHTLFEKQAEYRPYAVALSLDGKHLTYEQLNKRANQLAHYLLSRKVGPEVLVGICLERSFDMVISILAVLKSGGAYVPLDPHYPEERLRMITEDAQISLMLTKKSLAGKLTSNPAERTQFVCLDEVEKQLLVECNENPNTGVMEDNAAYVIYTSGTTGKPKGVLITHQNIARLFSSTDAWFGFRETDVWTFFHSYAFDFSVWELWGALLYGGRLVIVPYSVSRSSELFYKLVESEQVTVLNQTPTAFKQFMLAEERMGRPGDLSLRYIIFGGEMLRPESLLTWFKRHGDKQPQLINMYGITETTVHVTYRPLRMSDAYSEKSIIGSPIPDVQLYILDEHMRPVPTGTAGELYVGGEGLARGYLNQPVLTSQRFVPDPFSDVPLSRIYKTGDCALLLPDGEVQYLGRMDMQVKVRGFRIELGDIEAALLRHEQIKQVAVTVQDQDTDDPKIVAYIIPTNGECPSAKEVRQKVRNIVPDYMIPNVIVPITSLPLTENGKLDRTSLPWPVSATVDARRYKSPVHLEELLLELKMILQKALDSQEPIGIEDDLFDLGATSLTIMTMSQVLEEEYGVVVPVEIFFTESTLLDLAKFIHSEVNCSRPDVIENNYDDQCKSEPNISLCVEGTAVEEEADSINNEVLSIIRAALETNDNIQLSDDLFDLGATSLTLMTVTRVVEDRYGISIPVETFFSTPKIADIARFIASKCGIQLALCSTQESHLVGDTVTVMTAPENIQMTKRTVKLKSPAFRRELYHFSSSKQQFQSDPIPFNDFSKFLGLLKMEKVDGDSKYLYPSAGGRNCVQTYVYVKEGRIEGLEGGVYYYHPLQHELFPICVPVLLTSSMHRESDRPVFESSAFSIFFIAQLHALETVYVDYSRYLAKLDSGYMTQLLVSRQQEYNIGLYPVVGLDFDRIAPFFHLDEGHLFMFSMIGGFYNYEKNEMICNDESKNQHGQEPRMDITAHFKAHPVYEKVRDILRVQRERKFNILTRKELVQLTREQRHIRKFDEYTKRIVLTSEALDPVNYILRSSQRHFKEQPVPFSHFSKWLSTLRTESDQSMDQGLYTPPGGVSGLGIFVYAKENGVENLQEGIYMYNRNQNTLTLVGERLSVPVRACHTPFNIKISMEAKFFIFLISRLEKSRLILGESCVSCALIEAGMIGQVLMDRQAECGIGTVPIGGMDFDKISQDFLAGEENIYIHSFMCGSVSHKKEREFTFRLEEPAAKPTKLLDKESDSVVGSFPLSMGQKSLLFVHLSNPESASYNTAYHVRIRCELEITLLQRAMEFVIYKHPLLRTVFSIRDGVETQIVYAKCDSQIKVVDATGWDHEKLVIENEKEYRVPFRLLEKPGFRVVLFRISDTDAVLLFNIHHIITDYISTGLIVRDLWETYEKLLIDQKYIPKANADMRYFEFVAWQNEQLNSTKGKNMWNYWKGELDGELPILDLPTDKPRSSVQTSNGATLTFTVDKNLTTKLRRFSRQEKKTLYLVALTAFHVLLHRYSGQEDVIIGTTATARGPLRFQDVAGYFINPIVIRADLSGEPTFRATLERVSKTLYSALNNQDYPFPLLVEKLNPKRDSSRSPIFQVTFQLLDRQMSLQKSKGALALESFHISQQEGQFDLELEMMAEEEIIQSKIMYNKDLWNENTIVRFKNHYINLLEAVVDCPDCNLLSYDFLEPNEKTLLLHSWNGNLKEYDSKCIHTLFEEQADLQPDHTAVSICDREGKRIQISYRELNCRANRLAVYLRSIAEETTELVGICLDKSIEMVVAVLAVFKAGYAYVPVDPVYPKERIEFILKDCRASILITNSEMKTNLDGLTTTINLDLARGDIKRVSDQNLNLPLRTDSLAYVIYTSGSTGMPKGVEITHESAVNIFYGYREKYQLETVNKTHLQMAAFTFDVFIADVMRSLCSGGKLVLCPREYLLDPGHLYQYITEENIHIAEFVPAVMRHLVQYMKTNGLMLHMKTVIISSDSWNMKDLSDFRLYFNKDTRFINAYGVTEAAIDSTYLDCADLGTGYEGFVPIGRPFPNVQIYILDKGLNPTPIGVVGELCIGGKGVARGYLNRPDLTTEKFIPDPFHDSPKSRLYRTGDLARYLPDGRIEFLGRSDYQIKVRGFRIEVGEIEEVISRHPLIKEIVVLGKQDQTGESILVGYFTETDTDSLSLNDLQDFVRNKLPEYMVPTVFIKLDTFNLTNNGKIDRRNLPSPEKCLKSSIRNMAAPNTETEQKLIEVWKYIIQIQTVGIENNFFEVGGHSFLVIRLLNEIKSIWRKDIPLVDFLANPTIRNLANLLDTAGDNNKLEEEWLECGGLEQEFLQAESVAPEWATPQRIFLTGATGHLGIHLLVNLLEKYKTAVMYCLIRAKDETDAIRRLENTLQKYLLWREGMLERVVPVLGDLEKPMLGLSRSSFDKLAQEVDIVFHNGAFVNFAYPYEVLKKANVNGTIEVLKLASQFRLKPIHYISTTSVFENIDAEPASCDHEVVVHDNSDLIYNEKLHSTLGYTQSKWVAEKLVQRAREEGMLVSIYRPDVISGHSQTGVWNENDFASKTLRSIASSGIIPEGSFKFSWLPVDTVSQAIVELSSFPQSLNKNFNLASPYFFELSELANWLREAGFPIQVMPFSTWKKQMEDAQAVGSGDSQIPDVVWRAAEDYKLRITFTYDMHNAVEGLQGTGIQFSPISKDIICKYVNHFIQNGLLKNPIL
ncbi:amino acid adenylation domain-containing protein [Paenibacillus polymyxa]|uniref:amino acid adenylation domain-containing protein n=1 Tax=Paenibacillus polymyxa TaxID=1406 RepID=UPI00307E8BA2